MASADELVQAMHAQMAAWQAEQTANMETLKASLQATFDLKLAELTGAHGVDRRDAKDGRDIFDAKKFPPV